MAHLKHELYDSGVNNVMYSGLSWTSLFFGWLVPLIRFDIITLLLLALMAHIINLDIIQSYDALTLSIHSNKILIYGFSYNIIMFFVYNPWHRFLMLKVFNVKVIRTTSI